MRLSPSRFLVWCFVATWACPARAELPEKPALHWARAPGAERCIDGRSLARRVEDLTGPVFVPPAEAARSLEGLIAPEKGGFRVRIVSVSAHGVRSGERTLETRGGDCHSLDQAIAFVIALTLDPALSLSDLPPEFLKTFGQEEAAERLLLNELDRQPAQVVEPTQASPAPPAPAERAVPKAPTPNPERTRLATYVMAAALGNTLPAWAFGAQAMFVLDPPRVFPIALGAGIFPPAAPQTVNGGRARFAAYQTALGMCPVAMRHGRLRTLACGGGELSILQASGMDFDVNRRVRLVDPALFGNLLLALSLGEVSGFRPGRSCASASPTSSSSFSRPWARAARRSIPRLWATGSVWARAMNFSLEKARAADTDADQGLPSP